MIYFLVTGTLLGLSAGFAPGPLLALVIAETIRYDIKSGVKVALAPVITDLPIIILTLYLSATLSRFHSILGVISLAGGIFILFMGYESIRAKGAEMNFNEIRPKSLRKGVLVNALSPYPYLFWLSVGAPMMTKAMNQNVIAPFVFITGFYVFLVGSKIVLSILVGRSKVLLSGRFYSYLLQFLGVVLCGFAMLLFRDGLNLLNIL